MSYLRLYMFKVLKTIGSCFLLFVLFLGSCQLIVEEDLSSATIEIIAPRDGAISSENVQQFVWEPVEFALEYTLQIAKPSFSVIDKLVVDTTIENTKFQYSLPPGIYQWRIKAQNGSSETAYLVRDLIIEDTANLNGSLVFLTYPLSNGYVNSVTPTFIWEDVPNSMEYSFKIYEGDFENSNTVTNEIRTTNTSTSLPISLSEKAYSWGVRAENDLSKTLYSSRTFLVDITSPTTPVLIDPIDNQVTASTDVIFTWSSLGTMGSPEFDTIFVASDSILNNVVEKAESMSSAHTFSLPSGNYYWAVRRYDKAGNNSWISGMRKLTIQ